MHVSSHLIEGVTVVQLAGRFDAHVAKSVTTQLERVAAPHRVVVDLKDVVFVDSTGLATLVQAMKQCRQRDGDVRLSGLQQPVRIIFELTRLHNVFRIFDHASGAVRSFHA